MALVKTGLFLSDIRGTLGGVYFSRDKSGLHQSARPRKVYRRTAAQRKQQSYFIQARAFSKDPRVVSYNIYRAYLGLSMQQPPPDYRIPRLKRP